MENERDGTRGGPDPATDGGDGGSAANSGFTFNLGAALDRLGSSKQPSLSDLMRLGEESAPGADPAPDRTPIAPPDGAGSLPPIVEATSVSEPPRAVASFVAMEPPPTTTGPVITPSSTPMVHAVRLPESNPTPPSAAPAAAPVAAASAVAVLEVPTAAPTIPAPTIPTPTVPAVPAYVPPVAVPAAPIQPMPTPTALRPAAKRKKKSRFGLKMFMLLLVLGGLAAAGLTYGRAYLFPNEWERDLVPIADELEAVTGTEFAEAVRVEALPVADYDTRVADGLFGPTWVEQVPLWRALGLASGDPTATTLGPVLRSWNPAVYDPTTLTAARVESLGGAARTAAVTDVLAAALVDQVGLADLAVDPTSSTARRALIAHQIELTSDAAVTVSEPTLDRTQLGSLPAPLAYELIARADLGAPLAAAAGIELDGADVSGVAELPDDLDSLLGDGTQVAPAARLASGDIIAADATQRGRSFWYLVFGAYLPTDSAAAGTQAIAGELLTPVNRGEQACAYATFTAADPDSAAVLALVAQAWAAAAPPEAQASAAVLDDGTVQVVTCDPGTTTTVLPRTDVAAELVARQVAALAATPG